MQAPDEVLRKASFRGAGVRQVERPEPELYRRTQMHVSDANGRDDASYLMRKCPAALSQLDECGACNIVRRGSVTRHGVISGGFPEALSGVPRYHCLTHKKTFTILHPLVHEALPPDAVVQPEVVVLTNDLVFLRAAYLNLAVQVKVWAPLKFAWKLIVARVCFSADSRAGAAGRPAN